MRLIKLSFILIIFIISGLWLLAEQPAMPTTIQAFHDIFVQYSGVLSISVMSIAIFLATRPQWLETRLHGLDKLYRLHKWLGITLLVTATSHWLIANSVKIAVEQGNLGAEHLRPTPPASMGGLESFLFQQQGIAVGVAGLALWVISALLIIALIKKIPYRIFTKLHHWISLAYLLIAFHAIVMFKFSYWSQPLGWVMAVLLVAGIYSSLVVLTRRIGKQHKVQAELTHYDYHSDLKVIEANFKLANGWQGHEAGQFAFITTSAKEGAHPFSIASAWDPKNPNLSFVAKELGDYTQTLPALAKLGGQVTIEGPYGQFTFKDHKPVQIWVAGGIGITPFIARLQYLAQHPEQRAIYFFYSTDKTEPNVMDRLTSVAKTAGINFHLQLASRDGRLTADFIREKVPNWQTASLWFCGPAGFGDALHANFKAQGLKDSDFHQELFEFR